MPEATLGTPAAPRRLSIAARHGTSGESMYPPPPWGVDQMAQGAAATAA